MELSSLLSKDPALIPTSHYSPTPREKKKKLKLPWLKKWLAGKLRMLFVSKYNLIKFFPIWESRLWTEIQVKRGGTLHCILVWLVFLHLGEERVLSGLVRYIVFSFCWFFCILEKKGLFGLRVTDRHQGKPRQEAASRNHEGTLLTGLPTLGPYIQPRPPAQAWHCPRGPGHPTVSNQEREHTGGGTSFTEASLPGSLQFVSRWQH